MAKRVADDWYGVTRHRAGVLRIRERHLDPYAAGDIWLVPGSRLDLVFDTGTGVVPPGAFLAALSDRPAVAVVSCHYYDHAGGLHDFGRRACHRLEAALVEQAPEVALFGPLGDESFRALPRPGFRAADYRQQGCAPTLLLEDGDTIDLGDRVLEVLHVPGRTPGSIALFEHATGCLFGGETAFVDPLRRDFPPADNRLYEVSLARLAALPVKTVFGGHYGAFSPKRLRELVAAETGRYGASGTVGFAAVTPSL